MLHYEKKAPRQTGSAIYKKRTSTPRTTNTLAVDLHQGLRTHGALSELSLKAESLQ